MQSSLIAVVLCILAQTAGAQCVNTTDTSRPASVSVPQAATPRSGGELITTAAASTRDAPVARATPVRSSHDEDKDGSGGTGMLLAALALMSGIALRRYSANSQ